MNKEKCIFKQMGGTYTQAGDYLIPDITCKLDEQLEWIGRYGLLSRDYLKNHRNSRYQVMLMKGTLGGHLLLPNQHFMYSKP